jgi:hypothetical protein
MCKDFNGRVLRFVSQTQMQKKRLDGRSRRACLVGSLVWKSSGSNGSVAGIKRLYKRNAYFNKIIILPKKKKRPNL